MKTIHLCQLYKITFNIVWAVWQIKDKLEYTSDKNKSLTPINQLLIALRFYATGRISLLLVNDDTFSVRQQYVVQFTKVTAAIASLQPKCQVSNNKTNKNSLGDEIANVNFLTTISHTCRPTSKYRKNVHGSSMARWKARGRLPIGANWTFFAGYHGWGAMNRYWLKSLC